ncbi:hypothetical protein ACMSZ7_003273 [Listeria monocytogenes]
MASSLACSTLVSTFLMSFATSVNLGMTFPSVMEMKALSSGSYLYSTIRAVTLNPSSAWMTETVSPR